MPPDVYASEQLCAFIKTVSDTANILSCASDSIATRQKHTQTHDLQHDAVHLLPWPFKKKIITMQTVPGTNVLTEPGFDLRN